jgi:hypothetical protein
VSVTDIRGATLYIKLGERERTVYMHCFYPDELRDLANSIDELAGTDRWTKGEPD